MLSDHDVEFAFAQQNNILQVPFLQIVAGEKIAVAGANGAGKSTLVKLLARIHDVSSGSILVGEESIRNIRLRSLREQICYLPRDPVLFHGTLAGNLRFVRPTASESELLFAMEQADLITKVSDFSQGIQHRVGRGGCQLSGGERQRLAIARAILQRPSVLILDEATSCIDSASEALILHNLQTCLPLTTLIVVSHRLSTIREMRRLVVLSRGRIVADGEPHALTCTQATGPASFGFGSIGEAGTRCPYDAATGPQQ
jgi:ATP-binding cassette subfamily B protein